jgi:ketosteroid isomerase-like protein
MPDESTTSDLVEHTRKLWEAASRGEFLLDIYSPGAVLDTAGYGMGTFEGREAIRSFLSDWMSSFDDLTAEAEEIVGFGDGVVLAAYHQKGRPHGGSDYVRVRSAMVSLWVDGKVVRTTIYTETQIDQARAAAERLAEERAQAMAGESSTTDPVELRTVSLRLLVALTLTRW